jgi:DUF1680 family protein
MTTRPLPQPNRSVQVPRWLLIALLGWGAVARADISLLTPENLAATLPVRVPARPFALSDVRLLDGPMRQAMLRDRQYLLTLDADRLLHAFRLNAGLPSTAEPLRGWEDPKGELRGHFVGHYLSGCALMYAATGDEQLRERAALMVRELAKCQQALGPSGYLSAFPESFIDRVEAGTRVWAPYYTLHKIQAGLLDIHVLCGNAQALELARRFGDWVCARNQRLSDEQVERMLDEEHGGINESMANLYALTGERKYLETARRLSHRKVLDPLAVPEDRLNGLHANTQFPKVIGAARLYELTGETRYRTMARFFWDRVVHHHSYVQGGNSDHERFGPPDRLSDHLSPWTAESCNTYNMLKLTRHLFAWEPSAAAGDYYERALYNHILASQDPRTGMMAYHIPLYGGWFMPYNTTNSSFWCCTGTGVENHAKYGDSIYWQDQAGLYVNLFVPSILTWRERNLVVRQETAYPESDTTRLTFEPVKSLRLALRLRHPAWATAGIQIRVNGRVWKHKSVPGSFVSVDRTWKKGDVVEVKLPMALRVEALPDNPQRIALCYGPLVLAGELGTNGLRAPMPYANSQGDFFGERPAPQPVLITAGRPVSEWLQPVPGPTLAFATRGVGRPSDLRFVPFYRLDPQRYSLYWDVLTLAQWEQQRVAREAAERRVQELAGRTVDQVMVGVGNSERGHKQQGEKSQSGVFQGQNWRHAESGGWFSYELKVPVQGAAALLVTYWGDDAGNRVFDLLVDGEKVATQRLNREKPGQFFDVQYPLPATLISGKSRVTVRFQPHPQATAGGVFDCRVVKN